MSLRPNRPPCLPLCLLALLAALAGMPAHAAVFYVDQGNCAAGNGGTAPGDAVCTIQEALDLTVSNGEPDEVRVAQGTYTENLLVPTEVHLLGGFAPSFTPPDPDPALFPTTIDGQGQDTTVVVDFDSLDVEVRGFTITGGMASFPGGGGIRVEEATAVITNNVITGNEVPAGQGSGGGILVTGFDWPGVRIEGNEITSNVVREGRGGGISFDVTIPTSQHQVVGDNLISDNVAYGGTGAGGFGGGVNIYFAENVMVDGNRILRNRAATDLPPSGCSATSNGGGLFGFESTAIISNNTIRENRAEVAATGVDCYYSARGGGIYGSFLTGLVDANTVSENTAQGGTSFTPDGVFGPGDFQGQGGGVYLRFSDTAVTRNTISDNLASGGNDMMARTGGGLYFYSVIPLQVEENVVERNTADSGGGAYIAALDRNGTIAHNRFDANTAAERRGGGLFLLGDQSIFNTSAVGNLGDGVYIRGFGTPASSSLVTHLTAANNGGGTCSPSLLCYGLLFEDSFTGAGLRSSVIWGNPVGLWNRAADNNTGTGFSTGYSIVQDVALPPTSIAQDPQLVSGPLGDGYLSQLPTDGKPLSPGVDFGPGTAATVGLFARTTRSDGAVDVCARDAGFHYPVQGNPPPPTDTDGDGLPDAMEVTMGSPPDDADADDDGLIDGLEGSICTDPSNPTDTDGDGTPDFADCDSDDDGVNDGTEAGVTAASASPDTDQGSPCFVEDADPSTTTDPLSEDTDRGGVVDGDEDTNGNGAVDAGETDPNVQGDDDRDGDGLSLDDELFWGTDPLDADTDDDGLLDGEEIDIWQTNPNGCDTDSDMILDGTEGGVTAAGAHPDTDTGSACFREDADPTTTTNPAASDTDGDTCADGEEDTNFNGALEAGESDPNSPADNLCLNLALPGPVTGMRLSRAGAGPSPADLSAVWIDAERADFHRVYKGSLASLASGIYDHVSGNGPDNTPDTADDFGLCRADSQPATLVGDAAESGSRYYLVVGVNSEPDNSGEGPYGGADLDGDGVVDQLRPSRSNPQGYPVSSTCP